jgi:CARDB
VAGFKRDFRFRRWEQINAGPKKDGRTDIPNLERKIMKTRNISTRSTLISAFVMPYVIKARSIWAMLVGAFVYRCGAAVVLGSALALNAAAQSEVPTVKPKIKPLVLKFPDLWIPTGGDCWWPSPAWNSTDGIFYVAVGNKGNVPAPSCSLKVIEYRAGLAMEVGEDWMHFKDYWATVPPLAPGEQKQISIKVAKLTSSSDPQGDVHNPNKRPRKWSFVADGHNKVLEVNEKNNTASTSTMN